MKKTSCFDCFTRKAKGESSSSNGEAVSSSQVSIWKVGPHTRTGSTSSNSNGEAVSSSQVSIRKVDPQTRTVNYMGRTANNMDKWKFTKVLTVSDVDLHSRLSLPHGVMLNSILCYLSRGGANVLEGNEEIIKIKDVDTGTYHREMVICKDPRTKGLLVKGHWRNEFVNRRKLKAGYLIGLCWNGAEKCFEFSMLETD